MRYTQVMKLPIYDTPETDLFRIQDWNTGNQKIEEKINEYELKFKKLELDIKNFGVKGDGVTDDSDKIQEFFDYCSENKITGRITEGLYILGKQITIKSDTWLVFDRDAEFKQTHENTMINIQNTTHTGYNGYKNILITGGIFNCNGKEVINPMNCFFVQHAQNVMFLNCTFKNIHSYHALDINGSKNVVVRNCTFLNSYDSISRETREAVQIDLSAPTVGEVDVCWDFTPSRDILVENCYFGRDDEEALFFTSAVGSHNVRFGKKYENIIVRNNRIENCTDYAINGWKWSNCTIENNIIDNCYGGVKIDTPHRNALSANDVNGQYKGLEGVENNVIRDNKINNATNGGIFVRGKYITSPNPSEAFNGIIDNCRIENNTITCNNSSSSCITLLNSSNCTVKDNKVKGSSTDAIMVYSSYENVIENNTIEDSGNYGISVRNSTLTGTDGCNISDGNIITKNTIKNTNKCAVFITGGAKFGDVSNNTIIDCNKSASSSVSIIDISAKSDDITVNGNRFIDNTTFKNLVYVTNTCNRVLVSNNVSNTGSGTKYYNASINGVLSNNI